jgi:hypothetical protein
MEHQYLSLLQGVLQYEKKSLRSMCVIFSVAMVIIITFMALRFKKEVLLNRIIICSIVVVLCSIFGVYLVTNYRYQLALQSDINNGSFIEYTGEVLHDNYQRDSFYHNITIYPKKDCPKKLRYPDYGNQYQLHNDSQIMPVGAWTGTIVYASNSNIVVYWNVSLGDGEVHSAERNLS